MTDVNASNSGTGPEAGSADQDRGHKEATPSPRASGGKALGIIAVVLSLAAASVAGYLWYDIKVEQRLSQNRVLTDIRESVNDSKVKVTALEKEFNALREQQRDLSARIDTRIAGRLDGLETRQDALAERSEALSSSLEKVYEDLDRSLESWALEEVEQLLRIANHSLRLSGDISTAVAGLELADQRLEELANPAFLEVRKKLTDDITALKSLETIDIAGLALRLSGLASKVEDLPLARKTQRAIGGASAQQPGKTDGAESNRWLEAGGELLNDLKQLVRIQNIEEPAKPLLAPEQRYFLFSNLRLMLSGAQIAALRKDTATFRENLDRAAEWIREYFDTEHQGVKQLLGDVEDMSARELSPDLPDISDSLQALKQSKRRIQTR